ncbi:hypothetical protein M0805_000743 [Coniferiporia weirii]|nr:hypothetical protein M0805_000743 [Coniferiporia weirii]
MSVESPRSSEAPSASTPAPPGDHRKRRRNRTTQSCLNCHASKRMCDRKRPACQRCTTLGLTGLCVYEVDDPSQRNNFSDEKSHLRSRVAELEGVIREMKNKPHPRWAQKSATGQTLGSQSSDDDSELPLNSTGCDSVEGSDGKRPFNHAPSLLVEPAHLNIPGVQLTPVSLSAGAASSCENLLAPQDPHFLRAYSLPSPPSSPSSNSPRPAQRALPMADASMCGTSFNVGDLLGSASGSMKQTGLEDGIYGHMLDHIMRTDEAKKAGLYCDTSAPGRARDICGCIDNATAYNNLLELSVRLRKAVESLGRVADHRQGVPEFDCQLYSKICELDKLTSTALGNAMSPADRLQTRDSYFPPSPSDFAPTISPNCLNNIPQWDMNVTRPAFSGNAQAENFMSWDNVQRETWAHSPMS